MQHWLEKELNLKYSKPATKLQIADHEAAHAVMRKICSLPATRLIIDEYGGLCEGTGEIIGAVENLLIALAGPAWDTLEDIFPPVDQIKFKASKTSSDDISQAWRTIEGNQVLRIKVIVSVTGENSCIIDSIKESMRRWYSVAMNEIRPHRDLIVQIGQILHDEQEISAEQVELLLQDVSEGRTAFCPMLMGTSRPSPR